VTTVHSQLQKSYILLN